MSASSKDKAALLFDDLDDAMAPRSDPSDKSLSTPDPELAGDAEVDEAIDDLEEIQSVSVHLDSLNSALDAIEQRNDDIRAQLLQLLDSNREIRQSMQEQGAGKLKEDQRAGDNEHDSDDSKME